MLATTRNSRNRVDARATLTPIEQKTITSDYFIGEKNTTLPSFNNTTLPSFNKQYDLNQLRILIQHFFDLHSKLYKTYFVKRSLFNPIDELAFERDWQVFMAAGAQLSTKLKHYSEQILSETPLPYSDSKLLQQFTEFQNWFKKLNHLNQFQKIGQHLKDLLPHESAPRLHEKLCCSNLLIATILQQETR